MKKKVVENQKISTYIPMNVYSWADERSWIYENKAKFLNEDCKLKIIQIHTTSSQIPKKQPLLFNQMKKHIRFYQIHA